MKKNRLKRIGDEAAQDLSNYSGDFVDFSGDDDLVDFAGAGWIDERKSIKNRRFRVVITNPNNVPLPLVLYPGLSIVEAMQNDGNFDIDGYKVKALTEGEVEYEDADGNTLKLNVKGAPRSFNEFLAHVSFNPARIVTMRIEARDDNGPNALQLQTDMSMETSFPYNPSKEVHDINIGDYVDEYAQKDGLVTVPTDFTLGNTKKWLWEIQAKTTVILTMYFGAVLNPVKGLEKKAARAGGGSDYRKGVPGLKIRKGRR